MQIYISYFYQIRFFKPNIIPLSTAAGDPAWFHQGKGQSFQYKDKNGVWNGLRAEPFVPGPQCAGLCQGPEYCSPNEYNSCAFLRRYRRQLNELDFAAIMQKFEKLGKAIQNKEQFFEEPIAVLIVHEAPNNPCSERWTLIDWFAANGYKLKEWNRDI